MTTTIRTAAGHSRAPERANVLQVIVYGHSALFYWWPLWVAGYVDLSYDTDNMTILLNRQDDFFRHWIIGFGSGDLHMRTMGGQGVEMNVVNVLFVGARMNKIQRLIATKPDVPQQA